MLGWTKEEVNFNLEQKEFEKSMKTFLEAGVHFGHKNNIWNPNMKKYVFMKRNGVHIIDLQKTVLLFEKAYNYVKNVSASGGKVLFVGTKKQAKIIIEEEVAKNNYYYLSNHWVGGLLTNNKVIQKSINRLKELNAFFENEEEQKKYLKKQIFKLKKKRDRLQANFKGIINMEKLPDLIFIIDAFYEKNCVQEAKIMGITTCAMVDTNSDPRDIDLVIPSNDDAIRSISFFVTNIIKAIKEGEEIFKKNKEIEDLAINYDLLKKGEAGDDKMKKTTDTDNQNEANKEKNASKVKLSDIKELRELTNIGMMECKKALVEAQGNKEKAIKILKEKGLEVIAKRKDKAANEGVVFIHEKGNEGWMLKASCETDFVANSKAFDELVSTMGENFIEQGESFLKSENFGKTLNEKIAQTKEKIEIKDPIHIISENGFITSYLHSNKKIGVLVEITTIEKDVEKLKSNESIKIFAKDLAMQVAAMDPLAVSLEEVDEKMIDEQKNIFLKQLEKDKKDPKILEKIIKGKVNKYFSDQCLLEMESVKENKKTIKEIVKSLSKKTNLEFKIKQFKRLQISA